MVEPVSVHVATDESGDQYVYRIKPEWSKTLWQSDCEFEGFAAEMGVSVPPRECREYVMIPADQYREQQRPQPADLSPVERIKLIVTLATQIWTARSDRHNESKRHAVEHAVEIVAAACEIESEVK